VDETAVDDAMRRVTKTVNFGGVYGLAASGLSSRLGISQTKAAAFIAAYSSLSGRQSEARYDPAFDTDGHGTRGTAGFRDVDEVIAAVSLRELDV
jgi:hypothetical protein